MVLMGKIINGFIKDERFGFEEVTYLLLFGDMSTEEQLNDFIKLLEFYRELPPSCKRYKS